ncbi:DNA polymerase III beta subunit family protein [Actinopolyspora alba]|uniref:DNA polymerase III beta subunit family protein n=1 Tax=Actinopolyspora alba TaxID=673379 RepID=A0A1I1YWF0_9ACTN|nr:DNA polymerase III subunit beta [Actinopolyspora alba]SFE22360.1 DNA polymerase III beta subunit family protein [Actinopolyspora alba]
MTTVDSPSVTGLQIHTDRKSLRQALHTVGMTVARTSPIPALCGVLLETDEHSLRVSSTDYQCTVTTRLPARITTPGRMLLNHHELTKLLTGLGKGLRTREAEDMSVRLRATDDGTGQLSAHGYHLPVTNYAPEEFPDLPRAEASCAELDWTTFTHQAQRVLVAADTDREPAMPALSGVSVTITPNQLRLVATDRYRLAIADCPATTTHDTEQTVLIPAGLLASVITRLTGQRLHIGLTESGMTTLTTETTTVIATAPDEHSRYPKWERMMPTGGTTVRFERDPLARAANTAAALTTATDSDAVVLRLAGDRVALAPVVDDDPETVAAPWYPLRSGTIEQPMRMRFHAERLADALSTLHTSTVALTVTGSYTPAVFSDDDGLFRHLLMPMRTPRH